MGQKVVTLVLAVLVLVFAGTSLLMYRKYSSIKQNPQQVAQETIDKLLVQVGKLIVLPTGETPTVATVSDPEKLKDQAFFAKAKVGDKVLIYTNARKAILYSPDQNIIVEVAPISIGNQPAAPAARTTPAADTASSTGN